MSCQVVNIVFAVWYCHQCQIYGLQWVQMKSCIQNSSNLRQCKNVFSAFKSSCLREVQQCLEIWGLEMCRPCKYTVMIHFWRRHILCFRWFWSSRGFTDLMQWDFILENSFFSYQKNTPRPYCTETSTHIWLFWLRFFYVEMCKRKNWYVWQSKHFWNCEKKLKFRSYRSLFSLKHRVDSWYNFIKPFNPYCNYVVENFPFFSTLLFLQVFVLCFLLRHFYTVGLLLGVVFLGPKS